MISDTKKAYLEGKRQWITDFLSEILAAKSESGAETKALDLFCEMLDSCGMRYVKAPIGNEILRHAEYSTPAKNLDYTNRYNVVVSSGTGGKAVAINTHIDVVPPSPGQKDAYSPVKKGDILFARGACDAKGQIAVAVLAAMAADELELPVSLTAHIVVEEEFGGNGTLALLEQHYGGGFTADALINLEPTDMKLMASVRGAVWFDMLFKGVAGHAGNAASTKSAIYKAIAAIDLLKSYHASLYAASKDFGRFKDAENPMPLTIGVFNAGVWPSMVPGEANIRGLTGFLPNKTKFEVMDEISRLFKTSENAWIGEGTDICYDYRHNGFELLDGHEFLVSMREALRTCGLDPTPSAMTASTDAIFYAEKGIPSLVFGPGSLRDAHSVHEQIAVSDILTAAEALIAYLAECNNG
jgi:acetylornithine deacetylase